MVGQSAGLYGFITCIELKSTQLGVSIEVIDLELIVSDQPVVIG